VCPMPRNAAPETGRFPPQPMERNLTMQKQCARVMLAALAAWGYLALAQPASAQLPEIPPPTPGEADKVIQQQNQKIDELQKQLEATNQKFELMIKKMEGITVPTATEAAKTPDNAAIKKVVEEAIKEQIETKKSELGASSPAPGPKKDEWYQVGTDLKMNGNWLKNGLWFESANKDFQFHLGGRLQW